MADYNVFALRAGSEDYPVKDLYQNLLNCEGRFGWSYIETADLYYLTDKIQRLGWDSLSEDEKECYQPFLLDLKQGDYVVYCNMPEWGKYTIAKVTGNYFWKYDGPDTDFNHRFPVDKESVKVFDKNDSAVHPYLRARLVLPGRKWQIYAKDEFEMLLDALTTGKIGETYTAETGRAYLSEEISELLKAITVKIQKSHPNYALEGLLSKIFERVPHVVHVKCQGGAGDHGADIILTIEEGLPFGSLTVQKKCVVQVKSFEGVIGDTTAVSDIERAFNYYPDAEMGLIVTTAEEYTETFWNALEALRLKYRDKPIGLLYGKDVARVVMQYGMELIP